MVWICGSACQIKITDLNKDYNGLKDTLTIILQAAVLIGLITLKILSELPSTTTIPAMERHNYKECNIFMIQIDNMDKINTMQACSMESVSLQHQNLTVCLAVYVRSISKVGILNKGGEWRGMHISNLLREAFKRKKPRNKLVFYWYGGTPPGWDKIWNFQ